MEKDPKAVRFKFLKQLILRFFISLYQWYYCWVTQKTYKHEVTDQRSPLYIAWQGRSIEYKSGKNLSLEKSCLFSLKCEILWVHTSKFPLLGLPI